MEKLRKKLSKELKKREAAPRPIELALGKSKKNRMREARRDLAHVHFSIEASLANYFQEYPQVEDRHVDAAMRWFIDEVDSEDDETDYVIDILELLLDQHPELTDNQWLGCLESLRESISTWSSLKPGDRGYLNYVTRFVAKARSRMRR